MTVKQLTSFAAVNRHLQEFHAYARADYKLDNMLALMAYLGNPQDKFKVVHVAGTSGKTSTAYYMAALLTVAGRKTGLTVSPHVDEINERVQINGQPTPEAEFCAALRDFLELIAKAPVRPSWFEVVVAFAYWYFARQQVDYAVVEVGLGGLKDGTNVITRPDKVCVITDIGLDHINVLGQNLAKIAEQKIGIVGPRNTAFTYCQAPEVMRVFEHQASRQKAKLQILADNTELNESSMPDYQYRNWRLAYQVYEYLAKRDGLESLAPQLLRRTQAVQVPGRMDVRRIGGKTLVMDGAHNAQKMAALASSFTKLYPGSKPAVLLALRNGKDYLAVVKSLAKLSDNIIVTSFAAMQDVPVRSMEPKALAKACQAAGFANVQAIPNNHQAFKALLAAPENVGVITGSFYLLAQIRNNEHLA